MTDIAERPFLNDPRYRVRCDFSILRALKIEALWGLWVSNRKVQLPDIPSDAIVSESWISNSGITVDRAMVSLNFLSGSEGKAFFDTYVEALKAFVSKYKVVVDDRFLNDCLSWSLQVDIFDSTACSGSRLIYGFEFLGVRQLENTVSALKLHRGPSGSLYILNNSDDEYGERDEKYFSLAHYMALDDNHVFIHYHDFDDDSHEGADEVLHKIMFDRYTFANAMSNAHAQLRNLVESICDALGVSLNNLGEVRQASL